MALNLGVVAVYTGSFLLRGGRLERPDGVPGGLIALSAAALIVTALGGFVLLGTWLGRGGMRQREAGASRFPLG